MRKSNHIFICVFLFLGIVSNLTLAKEESNIFLRIDHRLFDDIYDEPPEITGLNQTMTGFTKWGDTKVILGMVLFLSAFGNEQLQNTAKLSTASIIGTGTTIFCLKHIVGRERPLKRDEKTAFPSGHAGFSFTLATVIGSKYPKWRIPLYLWATMVGISRIYLGRHYPSDVIAGALIGTAVGWQVSSHKKMFLKWKF